CIRDSTIAAPGSFDYW
nr:immunoglobulin heavy chain junction region [Macaca mulatta]MOW77952.1 immunoglobulin heavy chain junction region [Macaca mulatta]MOW80864.1 immunoglobulin heavy chain junction region [Macaca mulatta]MOW81755.1 immunoglobulin heavy chain junction region [Macaca mulatta]MOW82342.1 immunoglobulin heavy chain junction region [Macaca mulatta]